jgi:glyoxylase-like metal-dependent hydrolase (beta-lactamase superfamily II)
VTPRAVPITSEIFQVGGGGLTCPEDAAIYLIALNDGGGVLIDAGTGRATDRLLLNIDGTGVRLERIEAILLTHCHFDHTGGARALRDRLRCPVVMHQADAPYLEQGDTEVTAASWYGAGIEPCPVDRRLSGPVEDLAFAGRAVTALHIPGHSPGSIAYMTRSDGQRILFAQDVHGPLHPSLRSDRHAYQASLRLLLDLEADVLCEGHFGVFRGEAAIGRFIRTYLKEVL